MIENGSNNTGGSCYFVLFMKWLKDLRKTTFIWSVEFIENGRLELYGRTSTGHLNV